MKNVFITGCSRGLGSLLVKEFVEANCFVLPHFRKDFAGVPDDCVIGDIREAGTLEKIENALTENDINVFVNNAAIHCRKPFLEHSDSEIDSLITVNIASQIKVLKRVYNTFLSRGRGLIINVNSVAGIQPAPNEAIYSATKYALKGFSQSLQIESIGKNIKIIDVFPGAMKTDMTKDRGNFNNLIDPLEIAKRIKDIAVSENITSLETEVVIRKFIER